MELELFKKTIDMYKEHKATCFAIYCSYPKYVAKGYVNRVRKETTGCVHLGLNYKELMASKGVQIGNNGLPYGVWVNGYENVLIEHNGNYQVRMYPCDTAKTNTEWYLDNNPITKQELIDMGILKAQNKPHTECFNVKLENVIDLM